MKKILAFVIVAVGCSAAAPVSELKIDPNTGALVSPLGFFSASLTPLTSALSGTYQPLDADLTLLANVHTSDFGRNLLGSDSPSNALDILGISFEQLPEEWTAGNVPVWRGGFFVQEPRVMKVPATRVATVDADGDDSAAQIGHPDKPYATAQAAYDACLAGAGNYLIRLGIGPWTIHSEATMPARIKYSGYGVGLTFLEITCSSFAYLTDVGQQSISMSMVCANGANGEDAPGGDIGSINGSPGHDGGGVTAEGVHFVSLSLGSGGNGGSGTTWYSEEFAPYDGFGGNGGNGGSLTAMDCVLPTLSCGNGGSGGASLGGAGLVAAGAGGSVAIKRCIGDGATITSGMPGSTFGGLAAVSGAITAYDCSGLSFSAGYSYSESNAGYITLTNCIGEMVYGSGNTSDGHVTLSRCKFVAIVVAEPSLFHDLSIGGLNCSPMAPRVDSNGDPSSNVISP